MLLDPTTAPGGSTPRRRRDPCLEFDGYLDPVVDYTGRRRGRLTPLHDLTTLTLDASGTFTRASTAYHQQPNGTWVPVLSGEKRWKNARRVGNLWGTGTFADHNNGAVSGITATGNQVEYTADNSYMVKICPASAFAVEQVVRLTIELLPGGSANSGIAGIRLVGYPSYANYGDGLKQTSVDLSTLPQIVSIAATMTGSARPCVVLEQRSVIIPGVTTTLRGTLNIGRIQMEVVSAITDPPSELQVTGNGVSYYATANGNSVNGSGVVTYATGAALPGPFGLLMEPTATGLVANSGSMTAINSATKSKIAATGINTLTLDGTADGYFYGNSTALGSYGNVGNKIYTDVIILGGTCTQVIGVRMYPIDGTFTSSTIRQAVNMATATFPVRIRLEATVATTVGSIGVGIDNRNSTVPGANATTGTITVFNLGASTRNDDSPILSGAAVTSRDVDALAYSGIVADNETRLAYGSGNVDIDDWDGSVPVPTVPTTLQSVTVYAPGDRPA